MNKLFMYLMIAGVILVGAYYYWFSSSQQDAAMRDDTMMDDTMASSTEDAMMDDASGGSMMKDGDSMEGDAMKQEKGSYEPYAPEKLALAESGKVVLHFHADWCPICRTIEAEILSNPAAIPSGVHILKVDYDTATSLKQKYGVTYQHTFVQVDAEGNLVKKWGDALTLADVLARIQ